MKDPRNSNTQYFRFSHLRWISNGWTLIAIIALLSTWVVYSFQKGDDYLTACIDQIRQVEIEARGLTVPQESYGEVQSASLRGFLEIVPSKCGKYISDSEYEEISQLYEILIVQSEEKLVEKRPGASVATAILDWAGRVKTRLNS